MRSIAKVAGTALANGREIAVRSVTPKSNSLLTFTGQAGTHSPQPTHFSVTYRGLCLIVARNSPGGPPILVTSLNACTWMRASVAALVRRGASEHMAQSSVGKVLERRAM